jgi:hypothetical protein
MSDRFKETKNWGLGTKVCTVKQFSHRCGLVGFMTGGAGNLGQAGGLVVWSSSGKLSPGGSNLIPI